MGLATFSDEVAEDAMSSSCVSGSVRGASSQIRQPKPDHQERLRQSYDYSLHDGDILSLNCFPMIAGYYTALERTLFYGEPTAEALCLWQINVAVHRRGLELIKPGAVCKDIAAELNEIFDAEGLLPQRTFGYGCPGTGNARVSRLL
jgi:Xaa-Pro aminopeptidase